MKKNLVFIMCLILLLPACLQNPASTSSVPHTTTTSTSEDPKDRDAEGYNKNTKKSIFDDDVEAFVLDEDSNPFINSPSGDHTIQLVPHEALDATAQAFTSDTQHDQAQHGLKTIYFAYDEFELHPQQKPVLDYNLNLISKLTQKGYTIIIEGHACKFTKSAVYNIMLSSKRAQAVADYLVEHGIPRHLLKTVGRGSELCIVPQGTMEQQAPNRRVEFYVLRS